MNVTEDQHTQLALGIARLEEQIKALAAICTTRMDALERRMDTMDQRIDRLTAEQRWISVALAGLIGALGIWG